jgi:hypothetical protein
MTAIAWGLIVVGVGLFAVGVYRRMDEKNLRKWDRATLTRAQISTVFAAVDTGTPPEDETLQASARDLAASVLQNYPVAVAGMKFAFPGILIAGLGLAGLVPAAAAPVLLTFVILVPIQILRLNRQRQGAERLLSR